jgi:hypothetical protein
MIMTNFHQIEIENKNTFFIFICVYGGMINGANKLTIAIANNAVENFGNICPEPALVNLVVILSCDHADAETQK